MATFYIQLQDKLLQISGDLTAENISKALGYVPVSPNVTNELSQRVDNITFDSLKDNPFLQDGSGELNIVDESGNIIAKIDANGIHSVDFIAGNHKLTDKIDSSALNGYAKESWVTAEITKAATEGKVDLTGYATEEYVNNIDFYNINNNPIVNNGDGKLLFVDENGYIGLQLEEDGLYVKDVIADGHTLSQKADKSDIPSLDGYATESYVNTNLQNYATKDEVSDLVDMSVVTELQGKVDTLVGEDTDKTVRDIAVDVLTETLVSETATEAYDTLAEMSSWIKSHPEDATAMNNAIQKNATDISNLDAAYKAADNKVLTDAQEYTNNINFYTIKDNPIVDGEAGSITFVDETGYIGLKFSEDGIIVKDVVTPEHTLSSKADKSFVEDNYYNKSTVDKKITEAVTGGQVSLDGFATEQWVNEQGFLKEHQDISHLAEKSELPTKVSELENDSKFITIDDVPEVTVPTKVSELENDKGYITASDVPEVEIPSLDGYVKSEDLPNFDEFAKTEDIPEIPEIPSLDGYATEEWVNNKNYATEYELKTIDYSSINNVPTLEDETGELTIADESGNIGMKVASEAVYAKDFIAGEHKLSEKQDIITDIEDIRRGANKGDNSGVFVKFNELFAEGTLTTNESGVFNVVKTAMESNTPLLLCDNNYSVILVSHYPLKVGNTIIASGVLSLDVYNFSFTPNSNQVTVTRSGIATLSDNLVFALGLKSPLGKSYALPDADAEAWADDCLLTFDTGIRRYEDYEGYDLGAVDGFYEERNGYPWALPNSDFSGEVGLENTLASKGDTPSYYILRNSASPSTLELMGGSAPTRQEPGNIIAVMFTEQFQQSQEHEFVIEGNAWMLPEGAIVEAKGGETMLFVFSNDYIIPVGVSESFYAKRAEVLQAYRTINGVYFNGSSSITNYTTCSTAAATAAKTASLPGLTLTTGARVSINFTKGNTAASMTLNVDSTGAKTVKYRRSDNTPYLSPGTYDFIYTGSAWELLSTKGISKFTINEASYTGVVYPDSFIRFYYSTGVTTLNVSSTAMTSEFAEYSFEFNSGSTPTVFTYPSTWKWANGTAPTISANKTYHVSVVNNCAVIAEF